MAAAGWGGGGGTPPFAGTHREGTGMLRVGPLEARAGMWPVAGRAAGRQAGRQATKARTPSGCAAGHVRAPLPACRCRGRAKGRGRGKAHKAMPCRPAGLLGPLAVARPGPARRLGCCCAAAASPSSYGCGAPHVLACGCRCVPGGPMPCPTVPLRLQVSRLDVEGFLGLLQEVRTGHGHTCHVTCVCREGGIGKGASRVESWGR